MVDPFGNNNRQPSAARANGRQAMAEAIQHHMDRLGPNNTRAVYSNSGGGGGTFGGLISAVEHPGRTAESVGHAIASGAHAAVKFGVNQNRIANQDMLRGWRHPSIDKGHGFNPYDVLGQLGRQTATMFNPTTKAGLANMVSMFAGGPKGDASPMMGELGMPGQFKAYGEGTGNALDRGIVNEGPQRPTASRESDPAMFNHRVGNRMSQGAGIRGLVRRAQGVGGYKQANPLDVIEGLRSFESKRLQERDVDKGFINGLGRTNQIGKMDLSMRRGFEQKSGGMLEPYRMMGENKPFDDRQSFDFSDRNDLLNLARRNPENEFLPQGRQQDALKQALYDMLFSGKGLLRKPGRPGPGPGESPYGGGPFD